MKKFVYCVMGYEFEDSEAFGKAWKEAKAKATELHAPIYRLVIKGGEAKQEVFLKAGCFLSTALADTSKAKIF
jgi:hypothetical protein